MVACSIVVVQGGLFLFEALVVWVMLLPLFVLVLVVVLDELLASLLSSLGNWVSLKEYFGYLVLGFVGNFKNLSLSLPAWRLVGMLLASLAA